MVVVCCGAQMSKTELVFNLLGWTLHERPRPCLYIGPTENAIRTMAKDRFLDMVSTTPALLECADPRAYRQSTTERWYHGARVGFGWAGSGSQLRAHPAAIALCDEVDAFDDIPGEGDPIALVRARVSNYHNNKIGLFSTPTLEETSRIWSWYRQGTQERWCLECAGCGAWWAPTIEQLKWDKGAQGLDLQESARLVCAHCAEPYDDHQRRQLPGSFVPHELGEDGAFHPLEDRPRLSIRSFWISGMCSPFRPIGHAAEELSQAFRSGDPARVQGAVNTIGGEPYGLEGDSPGTTAVREKMSHYTRPAGLQMVTIGADVQADSIYYVVRGWGFNVESWLLDHGQLWGPTAYDEIWLAMANLVGGIYCELPVRLALIDSGYQTAQVYAFCRRMLRASPAKGHAKQVKPHYDSLVDEHSTGKVVRSGVRLWHVDTDHYKTALYARIRWPAGQPGDWHIPDTIDDDYCEQVVNEQRCVVKDKVVWKRTGNQANHYLDAEVLALCAAHICNVGKLPDPNRLKPVSPASSPNNPRGFQRHDRGSFERRL